jgi:hypothetical protein
MSLSKRLVSVGSGVLPVENATKTWFVCLQDVRSDVVGDEVGAANAIKNTRLGGRRDGSAVGQWKLGHVRPAEHLLCLFELTLEQSIQLCMIYTLPNTCVCNNDMIFANC